MKLTLFKDDVGEWRWRLRARNGRIQAEGGEGYKNRADCYKAMGQVAAGIAKVWERFKA